MVVNELCSDVAEGGESCLTSGDWKEPEENGYTHHSLMSNIKMELCQKWK